MLSAPDLERSVTLINVVRQPADRQVYMSSFCEAWVAAGGRAILRPKSLDNRMVKNIVKAVAMAGVHAVNSRRAYLVCSRGQHLLKSSLPFNFRGEIIPMLWDCWPYTWRQLRRDLSRLNVRTCFMTASDAVRHFQPLFPEIEFIHIPEGLDMSDYQPGPALAERGIDIYEIGRKYPAYHQRLIEAGIGGRHSFIYLDKKPDGRSYIFETFDDYLAALRDSKINISFPASVTDEVNREVETLTMRYWEGMLSRCVIVGHCPRELSDLVGYNPVIEADLSDSAGQLEAILGDIASYQPLVDRNLETARRFASWRVRVAEMRRLLAERGYNV